MQSQRPRNHLECRATTNVEKNKCRTLTHAQRYACDASKKSQQLIVEKQRSDTLLYQMLPRAVAQQLKMNRTVNAEHFDEATVYFSDIVGFTDLSSRSSPLQVVDFLNHLYAFFDRCLDMYDVYKVSHTHY